MSDVLKNSNGNLPNGFRNTAGIVSGVLNKLSLEAGVYLRAEEGSIHSAKFSCLMTHETMKGVFLDYKKDRVLSDKFVDPLIWPDVDFVYDVQLKAVFVDQGRYVLKFTHDVQDRGDLNLYYYFRAQDSEYQIIGSIENLKTKSGGKNRVQNYSMSRMQKWQVRQKIELVEDVFFEMVSIALISMPLLFSDWENSDDDINLGSMPAMTASFQTGKGEYKIGVKGEHTFAYYAYIEGSPKVEQKIDED